MSRLAGMFDEDPTPDAGAAVQVPEPKARNAAPRRERENASRSAGKGGGAAPAVRVPPPARAERRREQGKRSNPEYRQVALHMREATHFAAVDRLRHRREYADFGELVEALVSDWLKKK